MLRDLLLDALRNVRVHWLRVLLTSSGIVWGIALFIVMMATGNAYQQHYREKLAVIGRKAIWAIPGSIPRAGSGEHAARYVSLDRKDPPRLPGSPLIERAEPEMWAAPHVLKGGGHIKVVWVLGVGPGATHIRNFQVARGRFITPDDVAQRRRVLVIGAQVERRLFGRRSALGERVRLDGQPFRIVGVSVEKGEQMNNMGPRDDEQVLLPITTAQTLFTGSDRIDYILYEPRTREEGVASIERVRALISRHHYFTVEDEEALSFVNIADAITVIERIVDVVAIFLAACGLMTLAAGAVGVMNIMLVAVSERTREIGVRKAVGATPRDLFVQLIFETTVIVLAAGTIGVGLGAGIIGIVEGFRASSGSADFLIPHLAFPAQLAVVSFAVLAGTGILAGILPALRAARLDPAEALREE